MPRLPYDPTRRDSILAYAKRLEGLTFRDVIRYRDISGKAPDELEARYGDPRRKGGLGNLLEECYFGYAPNSDPRADFHRAGIELKASPYEIRRDGGLRAGERLVLSMIDYQAPISIDMYQSHFWEKSRSILLVYYLRDRSVYSVLDQRIGYVFLYSPPREDMLVIEEDYRKIVAKIQQGRAHMLSESDTMYLGACTKGATAEKSTVPQYYYAPGIPARKRAFCFKISYMTYVLGRAAAGLREEAVLPGPEVLERRTFEQYITARIGRYRGRTDEELCYEFGRPYNDNKAQWIDLAYRMLGIRSNRAEEFVKANITVKAVRVEENGRIRESSPLPAMSLKQFALEEWEDSALCTYFEETKFLFVVFQKEGCRYVLRGSCLWNMPWIDLHVGVRTAWEEIQRCVRRGIRLTPCVNCDGSIRVKNDLPKKGDIPIVHIRPHSKKRYYDLGGGFIIGDGTIADAEQLPDGRWMQKQSFWLNNGYLEDVLKSRISLDR